MDEDNKHIYVSTNLIIVLLISFVLLIGIGVLAVAWHANNKEISDRQLQEEEYSVRLQKEKDDAGAAATALAASEQESKRVKYVDCIRIGLKKAKTNSDISTINTLCKEITGYKL